MLRAVRRQRRNRRGQGLVEYALLIAGVALVSVVGIVLVGEKAGDMIAAAAAVLPGADQSDNGGIHVSSVVETTNDSGAVLLDLDTIGAMSGADRLGVNVAANPADHFDGLVVDPLTAGGS